MIKFSGKAKDFRAYMDNLIFIYGAGSTIKEICQMIGAKNNACM